MANPMTPATEVEVLPPGSFKLDRHLQSLDHTIERVLGGLTQKKVDKAGIRDLAVAYGILIDKKQLLEGKPTQILSIEERREMPQLLRLLLAEAERREMTLTVDTRSDEAVGTDVAPREGTVEVLVEQAPRTGLQTRR